MPYVSNSETDFREMLKTIGVKNFDELIADIPWELRYKGQIELKEALSELESRKALEILAGQNKTYVSFLGGGVYDHYVPAVVSDIASRPEFYTSYTPYQPEVSQGNLQTMYEFQSMVSELTEMDVTNASMYDGGTALAEAILLATHHTRKYKILMPDTVNWRYRQIVDTYTANMDIEIVTLAHRDFTVDPHSLAENFDDSVAAIVIQHPNYFGFLEDMEAILKLRSEQKTLLIQVYDPISLGLLQTPGGFGADIAVAEGQVLGNPQNYGGPFIGLFSTKLNLVRKMPGRLSGVTTDSAGRRGFVMTLQTREQHIRREKATSNICTNSGLLAVTAAVYLSLLGKKGIKQVANLSLQKAHYLADQLTQISGVSLASSRPFFKEFTLELPLPAGTIIQKAQQENFFAGIGLRRLDHPQHLLLAVTEKRTKDELDAFASVFKEIIA